MSDRTQNSADEEFEKVKGITAIQEDPFAQATAFVQWVSKHKTTLKPTHGRRIEDLLLDRIRMLEPNQWYQAFDSLYNEKNEEGKYVYDFTETDIEGLRNQLGLKGEDTSDFDELLEGSEDTADKKVIERPSAGKPADTISEEGEDQMTETTTEEQIDKEAFENILKGIPGYLANGNDFYDFLNGELGTANLTVDQTKKLLDYLATSKDVNRLYRKDCIEAVIYCGCPVTEEMIDGLPIKQEDKDSLKTSLKEVRAQQNASPTQVDVSTPRPAAAPNPDGKTETVSDPTKIFDKPQNPLTIIKNLRDEDIKNKFFEEERAKKAILVQEGNKTQEIHPILFWEIYARLKDANGQEYASLDERNTLIKEFLENGTSVLSSVKGHELDVYKVFAKSVLKGVRSDSLGELGASHNYKGLGLVSHHVLEQELAKKDPNKAYITEVMKALAQVPEAGFEDIQLSKKLLDKLKTAHPALFAELMTDPQVKAFLQMHEEKVEVINVDEKPLPYDTIKKENGETPEVWFARVARAHAAAANGNENTKHHAISLAYGEIAKLYKDLKGKTGAERKAILTKLANALSQVNASNSSYHTLLITPETGGSTGKLSEAQILLGYQGAVAEEMRKMQPKRTIKNPPKPFPGPTTQPKIDVEELERKKKALDAMAAARHDGAQEKTWWQRNKEWIYWLIGILVVSALGVFAFRKGGWFNKDKKSSSVAVTPNTNTNSNTNTNTNTGGGLADNSTLYKADEVCDALAGNSRVPPTFSNNGR